MCSPAYVVRIGRDHPRYIGRYFDEPHVRKLQTTYNTEERNRQKAEDGELDNTGHKSTSGGTTKQRGIGSYSGSASTAEDVLGKKGEENSVDSEEYDGRGWGPRPDAGSVVHRSKRRVSVRVYHTLRAEG